MENCEIVMIPAYSNIQKIPKTNTDNNSLFQKILKRIAWVSYPNYIISGTLEGYTRDNTTLYYVLRTNDNQIHTIPKKQVKF